jgi:hypothetical protein
MSDAVISSHDRLWTAGPRAVIDPEITRLRDLRQHTVGEKEILNGSDKLLRD